MERLGIDFTASSADIDEAPRDDETPKETARRLAARKARTVADDVAESYVIGADQTIAHDDDLLGKPGDAASARRQLRRLAGDTHRLHAAVALVAPAGEQYQESVSFEMEMRALSDSTIATYVDEDDPVDCAGAYKIERGGIRLFRAMRGPDYTGIVGLPLTRVWNVLDTAGYFDD